MSAIDRFIDTPLVLSRIGQLPVGFLSFSPRRAAMATDPTSLPSKVEEHFAVCPQFRILLVGNTGVGKSSLVMSVFNLDIKDIDIQHDRPGEADIKRSYKSDANPRFILHDSKGFEPGSKDTWDTVEQFIRDRSSTKQPLKERVHTIWLCIQTPRTGSRLFEVGDQKLVSLADELHIPVIIVFTKYDLLYNEKSRQRRKDFPAESADIRRRNAEDEAAADLRKRVHEYADFNFKSVMWVPVSTHPKYRNAQGDGLQMLRELTSVTRDRLHDIEGDLLVLWATAQQINAQQKLNDSINVGFSRYWIHLGASTIFEGQVLWNCISRIHRDMLAVWNFHDPNQLLSGQRFCTDMVKLIEPLLTPPEHYANTLSQTSELVSIASTITAAFGQVLAGAGIAVFAVRFLYGKYQRSPLTALCLGAYIVDLTLILHNLFITMLTQEPPRPVSEAFLYDTFQNYKVSDASRVHGLVRDIVDQRRTLRPEEKIADLIRNELKMETIH
uniref:G domain-containing protein n=1 Tax=Moniliophthora roreri TaxID=221103 RepID=A0A0W0FT26_MONRR